MVDEIEAPRGEVKRLCDLDSQIPEEEIWTHPVEELVPYQLDPKHWREL
uniref:Uncharacterized protein n=1 Tax=Ficus carica TaxID=3494 RepID=A0AA87Z7T0_FICCA|nr:hypothetical protein TIFTF001_040986 [Ficus carica]